jgi:hypothetical protein
MIDGWVCCTVARGLDADRPMTPPTPAHETEGDSRDRSALRMTKGRVPPVLLALLRRVRKRVADVFTSKRIQNGAPVSYARPTRLSPRLLQGALCFALMAYGRPHRHARLGTQHANSQRHRAPSPTQNVPPFGRRRHRWPIIHCMVPNGCSPIHRGHRTDASRCEGPVWFYHSAAIKCYTAM